MFLTVSTLQIHKLQSRYEENRDVVHSQIYKHTIHLLDIPTMRCSLAKLPNNNHKQSCTSLIITLHTYTYVLRSSTGNGMQFNTRSSVGPLQQLGFRDPEGQHEPPVSTAVSQHSGTPLSRAESDTPGTGHTHHPLATPRGSVSWLSLTRPDSCPCLSPCSVRAWDSAKDAASNVQSSKHCVHPGHHHHTHQNGIDDERGGPMGAQVDLHVAAVGLWRCDASCLPVSPHLAASFLAVPQSSTTGL